MNISRRLWTLAAAGGAAAVGVTTRDAGFVVITFLGGLALPRMLGIVGPGWRGRLAAGGCGRQGHHGGRHRLEERLDTWHRQAHGETGPAGPAAASGV